MGGTEVMTRLRSADAWNVSFAGSAAYGFA
jgi:hypothetical protein